MKSMYDDVINSWNVIEIHEDYISATDLEELESDSELLINQVQTRYNVIRKMYHNNKFQHDNAILLNNAKRSRGVTYAILHLCTNADEIIKKDCLAASLERDRSLINRHFEEVKPYNSDVSPLLNSDNEGTQEWLTELVGKYSKLNDAIVGHVTELGYLRGLICRTFNWKK